MPDQTPTESKLAAPNVPTDVEAQLSRAGARAAIIVAPVAIAVAAVLAGGDGALSATLAAVIIIGVVLMMGPPLSWAARKGPEAVMGVALGGFAVRMAIYLVLLVVLRRVDMVHGPSLAITGAVLMLAALVAEMRAAVRTPGFYWVFTGSAGQKGSTR